MFEIRVHNYGMPIAPDLLRVSLRPLPSHDRSRAAGRLPSGSACSISQQIGWPTGGHIDVTSTAAEGTRFTVQMPRGEVPARYRAVRGWLRDGRRRQFAIGRAHCGGRGQLRETRRAARARGTAGSDGGQRARRAGRHRCPRWRWCVVLLDLFMPVMDGWQVVDALRREGRLGSVRVVIVTSAAHRAPPGVPVLEDADIGRLMETIQQTLAEPRPRAPYPLLYGGRLGRVCSQMASSRYCRTFLREGQSGLGVLSAGAMCRGRHRGSPEGPPRPEDAQSCPPA